MKCLEGEDLYYLKDDWAITNQGGEWFLIHDCPDEADGVGRSVLKDEHYRCSICRVDCPTKVKIVWNLITFGVRVM